MSNAGYGCFKRRQPRFDSGAATRMFRRRGGLSFSDASAFQRLEELMKILDQNVTVIDPREAECRISSVRTG
jgi:methylphosphotriester-DNA--protein-cysteine methyltransferase